MRKANRETREMKKWEEARIGDRSARSDLGEIRRDLERERAQSETKEKIETEIQRRLGVRSYLTRDGEENEREKGKTMGEWVWRGILIDIYRVGRKKEERMKVCFLFFGGKEK